MALAGTHSSTSPNNDQMSPIEKMARIVYRKIVLPDLTFVEKKMLECFSFSSGSMWNFN
jgi:hypothetical protein